MRFLWLFVVLLVALPRSVGRRRRAAEATIGADGNEGKPARPPTEELAAKPETTKRAKSCKASAEVECLRYMVLNQRAQRPRPIELGRQSGEQMLYVVPGHKVLPDGHEQIKLAVQLGSELGPQHSFGEACKAEARCVAPQCAALSREGRTCPCHGDGWGACKAAGGGWELNPEQAKFRLGLRWCDFEVPDEDAGQAVWAGTLQLQVTSSQVREARGGRAP